MYSRGVIIKASPDDDVYLVWSTIADGPMYIFESENDLREFLEQEDGCPCGERGTHVSTCYLARIERAKVRGSSYMAGHLYHWDDDKLIVQDNEHHTGYYELPRARLLEYAQLLHDNRDDEAFALLSQYPIRDDDD